MPIEIKMPALSPTMETGNLSKWLVKEGDTIEPGDVIAEIETDKATMEVESADEGIIGKIVIAEGTDEVPIGETIAILLEEGEEVSAINEPAKAPPAKKEEPKEVPETQTSSPPPSGHDQSLSSGRIKASPLARRLAAEKGIDISSLQGSGPGGRIVKADVEAGKSKAVPAPDIQVPAFGGELDPPRQEVKINNVRKIVAERLTLSKTTIPHYYLTLEANITELLAVRKQVNEQFQGAKISINDFIIKAVALALMKVPAAHVQWAGDKMYQFGRADISVAVAIDGGLITPIIRGADTKDMKSISAEMKMLAGKAREGKMKPEEFQGGTFSISNLGMFGIKEFSAVINPPQSGILAIGAGMDRAVLKDGNLENQNFMSMTGSFDHRAVDGAVGAQLMKTIQEYLETPAVLLY
ncbi:MAG: pyruvate dehydrogenase complex dihydrolipoamide acetyltransferase [Alphaproteobacteria bacterium]